MGFIDTWKAVIKTPTNFYENMPTGGGFVDPLKFLLICNIPSALFMGLFYGASIMSMTGPLVFLILPPMMLVLAAVGAFIGAAIIHLGVLIFAGPRKSGFESTFRILSFAQAVAVASWIPLVGVIPALYGIYLGILGVYKVHKTTAVRAVLAYLGIALVLGVIVAAIVIFAIYSSMVSSAGQELAY